MDLLSKLKTIKGNHVLYLAAGPEAEELARELRPKLERQISRVAGYEGFPGLKVREVLVAEPQEGLQVRVEAGLLRQATAEEAAAWLDGRNAVVILVDEASPAGDDIHVRADLPQEGKVELITATTGGAA